MVISFQTCPFHSPIFVEIHSSRYWGISRSIYFLFLRKNICIGYSSKVPHWGASNEVSHWGASNEVSHWGASNEVSHWGASNEVSHWCASKDYPQHSFIGKIYIHSNKPKYWDRQVWVNIINPDQTLQTAISDQGVHCLSLIQHYFRHINRQ